MNSTLLRLAAPLAALLTVAAIAPPALASKPRCKLERISTDELAEGKLKLYASALELEGDVIDGLGASAFTMLVNGKGKGHPEKVTRFQQAGEVVDIILLVEVAAQYKKALDDVRQALKDFSAEQSPKMKVMLMSFGSAVKKETPTFVTAASLDSPLDALEVEDDSTDVAMTQAIEQAVIQLQKLDKTRAPAKGDEDVKLPPRRLIVVVSDGLNAKMDRATFKRTADIALKAHIPIHTVAYSPIDSRGPLLNLGDLSKRSNGTFRWAQKATDIKEQLDHLAAEVRSQYVLIFKTDISSVGKYTFGLQCRDMKSNVVSGSGVPVLAGSGAGLAWYWWVLICLFGGLVLLFGIGIILQKRGAVPPTGAMAAGGRQTAPPAATQQRAAVQQTRGAPQPAAAAMPQSRGGPGVRSGQLICVTGALAGQRFAIAQGRVTVGRGAHNSVNVADDPSVSQNHFDLRFDGAGLIVTDLGSSAGTFVNGRRIAQPQRLTDGDLVRAGENTQFKFRAD